MRSILVLNAKGGSGKTTVATNLAGWYASNGYKTALSDCDVQRSATDWLATRHESWGAIEAVDGRAKDARPARSTDVMIVDAPAATHGKALRELLGQVETCVVPVVPSPVDLSASVRFLAEMVDAVAGSSKKVKVATIANRARLNSPGRADLAEFLSGWKLPDGRKLPFLATLRQTNNYHHAYQRGLSIFEFAPARMAPDVELWKPLTGWLVSKRSLP